MNISKKSILTFFNVNTILVSISFIKYIIFKNTLKFQQINIFLIMYLTYIVRNYLLFFLLTITSQRKQFVSIENNENKSNYKIENHLYLYSNTFFDVIITFIFYKNIVEKDQLNILKSLLYFIPKSLLFEIILDLFHYWSHRFFHLNKYLYKNIHKTHHKYKNPVLINAFCFNYLDILFTVTIPIIIILKIIPFNISLFEYIMISVYKQYTELAGHSGKRFSPASCFPQCIWIPRLLKIELYAEDHDIHHKLSIYNFSKRFSLWDKIFGTYKSSRSINY